MITNRRRPSVRRPPHRENAVLEKRTRIVDAEEPKTKHNW
uniref:Uncharacterized protein n=1 Tax=Anopheles atroparvus TaxID=41427 RepID=A0AAG5DUX9_ANOAO